MLVNNLRFDALGQRIALHASLGMDHFSAESILRISKREVHVVPVPLGKIVATAVIARVVIESHDKWFFGPYGWVFEDVIKLDEPIPARGHLSLWQVPDEIEKEINRQLHRRGKQICG